ncbi:MAG TPA: ABC transporter permease [Actinomycetota bacterium]|jgi:ABC-2 type transport system permease protein
MSDVGLLARQVRYTNKTFWRNPASAFFTFVFPLLFLVIFTSLLGGGETPIGQQTFNNATYYVVAMATFGVISACYTNIAISIVFAREEGVLKRVRGTPLPGRVYLIARVAHATLVGLLLVAITAAFGMVVYDAEIPTGADLGLFVITLLVGAGCFSAIGLAVSGLVPNADAGPPIVNAVMLPLLFLSGVFIPIGNDAPSWVRTIGEIFPVRHFFDATRDSWLGTADFQWSDVVVMAVWMVAAIVVASRTFKWETRHRA